MELFTGVLQHRCSHHGHAGYARAEHCIAVGTPHCIKLHRAKQAVASYKAPCYGLLYSSSDV